GRRRRGTSSWRWRSLRTAAGWRRLATGGWSSCGRGGRCWRRPHRNRAPPHPRPSAKLKEKGMVHPSPLGTERRHPMLDIAIIEGVRTPFVKSFGPLASVPAQELGRLATVALLKRADFRPEQVEQVVFGNVATPPEAANIARVI